MEQITFDKLPEALGRVLSELSELKGLISKHNPQLIEQDQILTIEGAAKLLSLKKPTIYGLVHRNGIPHSKKGKFLYFSKQELIEWVKSGRRKTNAEISEEATNYVNRKRR